MKYVNLLTGRREIIAALVSTSGRYHGPVCAPVKGQERVVMCMLQGGTSGNWEKTLERSASFKWERNTQNVTS